MSLTPAEYDRLPKLFRSIVDHERETRAATSAKVIEFTTVSDLRMYRSKVVELRTRAKFLRAEAARLYETEAKEA